MSNYCRDSGNNLDESKIIKRSCIFKWNCASMEPGNYNDSNGAFQNIQYNYEQTMFPTEHAHYISTAGITATVISYIDTMRKFTYNNACWYRTY